MIPRPERPHTNFTVSTQICGKPHVPYMAFLELPMVLLPPRLGSRRGNSMHTWRLIEPYKKAHATLNNATERSRSATTGSNNLRNYRQA